jgi:ADP-heptose:LPS heptosyltransferase
MRYDLDNMADACTRLQRHYDARVVVIAGPDEEDDARRVAESVGTEASVFSATGSFLDTFHLLRESDCLIANDSSVMHLATAARCPVVAIWGPTNPARSGPWCETNMKRIVTVPLSCRPCYRFYSGALECTNSEHLLCLKSIRPEAVVRAADDLLANRHSRRRSETEQVDKACP